jgi:hypothetical protein
MLTELDWLHAIVYTDGWDILADELLFTVPEDMCDTPAAAQSGPGESCPHGSQGVLLLWCCQHRVCNPCSPLYEAGFASSHVAHGQNLDSDHLAASCASMMGTVLSPHAAAVSHLL